MAGEGSDRTTNVLRNHTIIKISDNNATLHAMRSKRSFKLKTAIRPSFLEQMTVFIYTKFVHCRRASAS